MIHNAAAASKACWPTPLIEAGDSCIGPILQDSMAIKINQCTLMIGKLLHTVVWLYCRSGPHSH